MYVEVFGLTQVAAWFYELWAISFLLRVQVSKVFEYLQCVNLLLAIVFLNGGAKSTVLVACKSTSCEHHRTRFYHKGPKDPQK